MKIKQMEQVIMAQEHEMQHLREDLTTLSDANVHLMNQLEEVKMTYAHVGCGCPHQENGMSNSRIEPNQFVTFSMKFVLCTTGRRSGIRRRIYRSRPNQSIETNEQLL